MEQALNERLEAYEIFYRDKSREEKSDKSKSAFYMAYAAGIARAKSEILKYERQEQEKREAEHGRKIL